jgi:hypothetical protein
MWVYSVVSLINVRAGQSSWILDVFNMAVSISFVKAHIVQVVCLEHCYLSRQLSVKAKFIIYYTIHGYRCHGFAFSTGIVLTLKRLHFSLAWYYHCTQYRLVPFTSLSLRPVIGVAAGKFQFVLRIRTVHQHIQTSCGKFDLQMR